MSEEMRDIYGKEFSESTIANALEKQCGVVFKKEKKKYSVVSFVSFGGMFNSKDRVIINFTPSMKQRLKDEPNLKQMSVDKEGKVRNSERAYKCPYCYTNETPIFGEIEDE